LVEPADQRGQQYSKRQGVAHGGRVYTTDRISGLRTPSAEQRDIMRSEAHAGELHVGRGRLDDLDYVENATIEVMKRIIHGDLPPGARELL
jgi:hypothetical protein